MSKKKLVGLAWTAGAVLVGLVAWSWFDGEEKIEEIKGKTA
ncbi:MAG TPA: hypothetical protein VFG39_01475 [Balneolaceae bacterium]|nr:hypothetical protein [Balneolaceae bacterium]